MQALLLIRPPPRFTCSSALTSLSSHNSVSLHRAQGEGAGARGAHWIGTEALGKHLHIGLGAAKIQ